MDSQLTVSELEYENQLERRIKSLIEHNSDNITSFKDIIIQTKGAYPPLVKKILDENHLPYILNLSTKEADELKESIKDSLGIFSAPHPADYDWRFSKDSVRKITNDVVNLIGEKDQVALLGTQTLYEFFVKSEINTVLFNKSKSILDDLREAGYNRGLIEHDLFYSLNEFNDKFKVVVSDPPWYTDYYLAFMVRSSEMLSVGGYLYLSVLPELTRPSAIYDRKKILFDAERMGFLLINQIGSYFKYETPTFEFNSLKEEGIVLDGWRTGDLWVFKKNKENVGVIETLKPIDEPEWIEISIFKKKIKIKKNHIKKGDNFTYDRIIPEDKTLSSISRRSPIREKIDVWTSDNYAFEVSDTSLLLKYLSVVRSSGSLADLKDLISISDNMNKSNDINILNFISLIL